MGAAQRLACMRIAIPIHSFEPGGVERVALRLAGAWQEAGDQVEIILGRDEGPCRPSDKQLTYSILTEPVPTARWETLWMIWSLWRFLSRHHVDLIFCPGNTYTVVCVTMRLLLGRCCPPCLVKISNDLDRPDFPRPVRVLYGCWLRLQGAVLDQFVAIGAPMRPQLEERLGIPEHRTSVIPDPALDEVPATIPARLRRRPNPTACRFVAVGRLVPQKNLGLALEAFAVHGWPNDTLTIAGDGPERISLERLAAKLHLGDRARFIGHTGAVDEVLREADVFVLSSDYEGVPAVILEALAVGLPIAATDCCASMRWLLQDEAFGVLAPRRDADALGLAMNLARHLEPPREAMTRFASQFSVGAASTEYRALMETEISRHRGRKFARLRAKVREWREGSV